jgi:hypothetical protein
MSHGAVGLPHPVFGEMSSSGLRARDMPKPSPIALVVCDALYQDPSGKTALVGLFNLLMAQSFPATHPQMCVYVAVTDVHPGTGFRVVIENPETGHKVAEATAPAPPPGKVTPTTICEFRFILQMLTFPEPGRYDIQFWANDHILLQRPFEVVKPQTPKGE